MRILLATLTLTIVAACDGGSKEIAPMNDANDEGGLSFASISRDIIAPRCSGPACHNGGALSFQKRVFVVGVGARGEPCQGQGMIVVPFEPTESLLYTKIVDPPCGSRMPFSLEPLSSEDIEALRRWIEIGAP